jgi:hypothetical protein
MNAARPTTAAPVKQATGTAVRTMLQIASLSTQGLQVLGWGISCDSSAAATPGNVELFGTTVAATAMTALAAADVQCYTDANAVASDTLLQFGTGLTAYAPGAGVTEGTVANYRHFDNVLLPATGPYNIERSLGNECVILLSQFVRVRVTLGTTTNMLCWVDVARV